MQAECCEAYLEVWNGSCQATLARLSTASGGISARRRQVLASRLGLETLRKQRVLEIFIQRIPDSD